MDKFYTVTNWREYQHYRDRNPPWIKLHFSLLSSRDWVMLDDTSRVLAIACMLVASRNEGRVPVDPEYLQRVAYLKKPACFKSLLECGFLHDASACKQMLANARPETETETETETELSPVGLAQVKPATQRKRVIKLADESQWLADIKAIYQPLGVDVDIQAAKAKAWLMSPKGRGRKFTQQFFVNWLSRADVTVLDQKPTAEAEKINKQTVDRMNAILGEDE